MNVDMKRLVVVIGVVTIAVMVGSLIYLASSRPPAGYIDGPKLVNAIKTYTASLRMGRSPIPASVSLQELISRRLLTASDVSGFSGQEVTFNLHANETRPQDVLIRARLADGQELAVLADGSVQQVTPNRRK